MIKQCLLPVAGLGTRMSPITKVVPKAMLPISNKPLIHYAINEAYNAGIKKFTIISSKEQKIIKNYLDIKYSQDSDFINKELNILNSDCHYSYVNQIEKLGLGDAILRAKDVLIKNEPFIVSLVDDLHNTEFNIIEELIDVYKKYKCTIIAVEEISSQDIQRHGAVICTELEPNIYKVNDIVEKPSINNIPSHLALMGRFILTDKIFDYIQKTNIDKQGEISITEPLSSLAKNENVIAYKIKGHFFDCGYYPDFVEAINYFYKLSLK